MWETQVKFYTSGFGLAQLCPLPFGEWTSRWKNISCLSPHCNSAFKLNKSLDLFCSYLFLFEKQRPKSFIWFIPQTCVTGRPESGWNQEPGIQLAFPSWMTGNLNHPLDISLGVSLRVELKHRDELWASEPDVCPNMGRGGKVTGLWLFARWTYRHAIVESCFWISEPSAYTQFYS